jgi:putative membrane protein
MSYQRSFAPAIAGLLSLCFAAAVTAQTTQSPGTGAPQARPPAAKSGSNAAAPGSTARSTNDAASSNAMGSNNATAMAANVSSSDRKFMEKAAQGGLAEVQLGKLAADKASSDAVKQFGQRMVDDHTKANDQLKALATSKGVNVPTGLDRSTQGEMDKLQKMSGAAFDREYMNHMVSDHKKDIGEFKSAAKSKDADVKQFASSTLPTLEQHLDLAKSAQQQATKNASGTTQKTSSSAGKRTGS